MAEQDEATSANPRDTLISLLSMDFTPPDQAATLADPDTDALAKFVAKTRAKEEVEARLDSLEAAQLAGSIGEALGSAPITDSFKGIIIGYAIRAYAMESAIDETVSPGRLGLIDGEGIFDSGQAKEIEAQALRRFLFDIINTQVLLPEDETNQPEPIVLNPAAYAQLLDSFDSWTMDYVGTYGEDAFAGTGPEAYLDAAKRVNLVSGEEAEESGWAEIIDKLRALRENKG